MRLQTPIFVVAIAAAAVIAGCGGSSVTPSAGTNAASSGAPVASAKVQNKDSDNQSLSSGQVQSLLNKQGLKPIAAEKAGSSFPLEMWIEPVGASGTVYRLRVHIVARQDVNSFMLYTSAGSANQMFQIVAPSGGTEMDNFYTFTGVALKTGQQKVFDMSWPARSAPPMRASAPSSSPRAVACRTPVRPAPSGAAIPKQVGRTRRATPVRSMRGGQTLERMKSQILGFFVL